MNILLHSIVSYNIKVEIKWIEMMRSKGSIFPNWNDTSALNQNNLTLLKWNDSTVPNWYSAEFSLSGKFQSNSFVLQFGTISSPLPRNVGISQGVDSCSGKYRGGVRVCVSCQPFPPVTDLVTWANLWPEILQSSIGTSVLTLVHIWGGWAGGFCCHGQLWSAPAAWARYSSFPQPWNCPSVYPLSCTAGSRGEWLGLSGREESLGCKQPS